MAGKQEANDGPAQKKLPPQVEKMLASAKEMEAVLSQKLALIDSVSMEKSEMAKQEAMKIKADVEEIKRLSLLQTKEGDEALRAKIMEVNKRIETTTRKAAELQLKAVDTYKTTLEEIREITNHVLDALSLNEKKIKKRDADLIMNRVLTFEKHAAMRTEYSLKVLRDAQKIVEMRTDPCNSEFVLKRDLLLKIEYYAKLLNSLCPGIVRQKTQCPAEKMCKKMRRTESQ